MTWWKDGSTPHGCGFFLDEHELVNGKWTCPEYDDRGQQTNRSDDHGTT